MDNGFLRTAFFYGFLWEQRETDRYIYILNFIIAFLVASVKIE